jgi:ABC-2 type transport system permease protein
MLLHLTIANIKMIVRNRQALFWALLFPLIFVVVFGLFRLGEPPTIEIGVVDKAQDSLSRALVQSLDELERFELRMVDDEAKARKQLLERSDPFEEDNFRYLLVIPEGLVEQFNRPGEPGSVPLTLVYDQGEAFSGVVISTIRRFVDRVNLERVVAELETVSSSAPSFLTLLEEGAVVRDVDYFDFLLPGFIGMGVMTYTIIGMASVMTHYREQKILKRLLATPLRIQTFFAAQIIAYLILSLVQAAVILAAGILLFGGDVYGNYLWLFLLVLLGNLVFLNLGFIVGAYAQSVQAASSMGNALTVPMMFFSGVFFPTESLPGVLAAIVKYLPLSPLLDAMRGVALEARPIWDFPWELSLLGGWVVVSAFLAVRTFKFS